MSWSGPLSQGGTGYHVIANKGKSYPASMRGRVFPSIFLSNERREI
jgi:hypothetical protein